MTAHDDRELKEWSADWQAAAPDAESPEQIRRYVKQRGGLIWSWAVTEFAIAGVAVPLLTYLAWATTERVERIAMLSLASITIAAVCVGWWNWRGVVRSSATTVAEYVAISAERHRRMRVAWRIGWAILIGEVSVMTIWIWDHLYSGVRPHNAAAERFAWGWLGFMTIAALIGLLYFGRWIERDADRFEALKRDFEDKS